MGGGPEGFYAPWFTNRLLLWFTNPSFSLYKKLTGFGLRILAQFFSQSLFLA